MIHTCIHTKNYVNKQHTAFTLAEILITLGIIGVVAAMTIPTLINNYQKTQYVTQLKKVYSTLQQGFKMYLADEGVMNLGDTDLFDGTTAFTDVGRRNKLDAIIRKYFNVTKSCISSDTSCNSTGTYLNWTAGGTKTWIDNTTYYIFQTLEGMNIGILLTTTCAPDNSKIGNMKASCGSIVMDLNGAKPPNTAGRDIIYSLNMGHDGALFPLWCADYAKFYGGATWATSGWYWKNDSTACGDISNSIIPDTTKGYCTARIMEEGWRMNY